MGKFLEYLLEHQNSQKVKESAFSKKDFKKHNYLKDVLQYIVTNGSIQIGVKEVESTIEINDLTDFQKLLDDVDKITYDDFNKVADKFGFSWNKIFKGQFTGKTAGTDEEFKNVAVINKFIEEYGKDYSLKLPVRRNDGKIVWITHAKKQEGTPKADITIYGFENNDDSQKIEDAVEVLWLSHKKDKKPNDFQQYGGISPKELSNVSNSGLKSVQDFVVGVKILFTDKKGKRTAIHDVQSDEIDESLFGYAVYGKDFDSSEYGLNNVNFLVQGDVSLEKRGEAYDFTANHVEKNPEIPTGIYKPKFCTRTSNDRITWGIIGMRIGIYPEAFHKSAKDLLDELKKKFKIESSSLSDFIDKYLKSDIDDFYHTAKKLTYKDILKFKLKP